MTSNPYDFEKIQTLTSEMIVFARDVMWLGVSKGQNSPDPARVREVADWLDERAAAYKAREEQESTEKAFIAAVEARAGTGWTYPGAIRKVLADYKLEKL